MEAIFRRPVWRESGRKFSLGVRIAIIALGILEVIIGATLQFPTDSTLGLSNAGVGVALIGLGFSLIVVDDRGKSMRESFQKLSTWFDALLTNRESPLVSRMESLKKGILGVDADSLSSEIKAVKTGVIRTEESTSRQPSAISALKAEVAKLSESIAALAQSLQTELSSLESRQALSLQTELSSLSEEVRKLPTYKELNKLKKEVSAISKQVKKIEEWN